MRALLVPAAIIAAIAGALALLPAPVEVPPAPVALAPAADRPTLAPTAPLPRLPALTKTVRPQMPPAAARVDSVRSGLSAQTEAMLRGLAEDRAVLGRPPAVVTPEVRAERKQRRQALRAKVRATLEAMSREERALMRRHRVRLMQLADAVGRG